MFTNHTTFNAIHRIDFQPETFTPQDLLWLPHHALLERSGKKRQTEHLAGRIAAVYALRTVGEKSVPGIGENRAPLWPIGLYGSISHCGQTAIAIVSHRPVGIDIEEVMNVSLAESLAEQVASGAELTNLRAAPIPFPLALTLAFSAKESLYKALSARYSQLLHFHDAVVTHIDAQNITLHIPTINLTAIIVWYTVDHQRIVTLYQQP